MFAAFIQLAHDSAERAQHLLKIQNTLFADLRQAQDRCARAQVSMNREAADVRRMEGLSFASLIEICFGTRESRLEQEKQEQAIAELRHREASAAVDDLHDQLSQLSKELQHLGGGVAGTGTVMEAEALRLQASSDSAERHFGGVALLWIAARRQGRELTEAIEAGRAVLPTLAALDAALQSASNWGTYDLLGGGLIASSIKHSRINAARQHLQQVQLRMRRLNAELADIHLSISTDLDSLAGFTEFVDVWFDGFFTDWSVQNKIHAARSRCGKAQQEVQGLLNQCAPALESATQEAFSLVQRLRDLG